MQPHVHRGPGGDAACAACTPHVHLVEFYESDAFLAGTVARFLAEGLEAGGACIVVATSEHCEAFAALLEQDGHDAARLAGERRLIMLDAAETLAQFMTPHGPDASRFQAAIGAVMDGAAPGFGPLRVYGEMVALLWSDGDAASAIELEDLWNDFAAVRDFELLCAYPLQSFDGRDSTATFARICRQHSDVIPSEEYSALAYGEEEERRRVVARLQQEVAVLRRELRGSRVQGPRMPSDVSPARRAADMGAAELALELEEALCAGDAQAATAVLKGGLAGGIGAAALIARVVAPAMHAIGERWARGELSVEGEHAATFTCQRAVTSLYPALLSSRPRSRESVLVAGVQGERHALAPRLVADVLLGLGYDVVHVGSDVPPHVIAERAAAIRPAVVALSATMPASAAALARSIAAVQQTQPDMLFLLGGQGVPASWAERGIPVADSVEEAGRTIERLVRERPAMPMIAAAGAAQPAAPGGAAGADPAGILDAANELGEIARAHALSAHELRFLAMEDALTGLPNRRAFEDRLDEARAEGGCALLVIDVDGFKQINDGAGHAAGDELLVRIGAAITEAVRPGDLVARLGGDEFGVLLAGTTGDSALAVAERVRRSVEARCAGTASTVSVGAAAVREDRRASLLEADRALYAAKSAGRNAVMLADGLPAAA